MQKRDWDGCSTPKVETNQSLSVSEHVGVHIVYVEGTYCRLELMAATMIKLSKKLDNLENYFLLSICNYWQSENAL